MLFRELGVLKFKGRTMSLWLREIPSYEKVPGWRSTIADYHASRLREGRMPKSGTPTHEVPSSERREYLGPSQRLHVKSADQRGSPVRIAILGSES